MSYKVLIVDDFMMSRQVFENAISKAEEFELAGTLPKAGDAVEFVSENHVDLVIMDIVMTEGINGLSAAKKIKELKPGVKILVVTSMPEVSYINRARQIGVESFWYKEVQERPILEVMQRTMEGEQRYWPEKE